MIERKTHLHWIIINMLIPNIAYSGVREIATRILHEISLLIGELAIRGTKLIINAGLGTENKLL